MSNELIDLSSQQLRDKLINSKNPDEIDDIVKIFNLNLKKRELIRADIYSELQDKVTDQIGKRIEKNSDTFSNKDLLEYMTAIQNILNKQDKEETKIPTIAIQNNLTINQDAELSKESRDKIKDAIQAILAKQNQLLDSNNINEGEVIN